MKVAIILGTRPEIIKFSPIIRELGIQGIDNFIIHTNQHYSDNLDTIFFQGLNLPEPKFNLNVGSHSQGKQTGMMLERIEQVLKEDIPDFVLVQGDTNSGLAGALAAKKLMLKVAHIEAGLRSYDERMPEEINRKLIDHMADVLFPPAKLQKNILIQEGVNSNKIFVVGNTIVDAVEQNSKLNQSLEFLNIHSLIKNKYFLITFHRAENTNSKKNITSFLDAMGKLYKKYKMTLFCPLHPRTQLLIQQYNLPIPEGLNIVEPVGYLPFLQLMKNARVIVTDSGGLQEEACILGIPCVTLRNNTERPETVDVGANIIAGLNYAEIDKAVSHSLSKTGDWQNPFGKNVAKKIVSIILKSKKK